MKIIIACVLLFVVGISNAQQTDKTLIPKSEVKVINSQTASFQIDSTMLSKKIQLVAESEKTVAYYDEYIKALEVKIAYVKADVNLSSEAEKNGWFIQMDNYIEKAKHERTVLINSK